MFGGCSVVGQKSLNIGETPSVDGEQLLDRKTVAVLVSILLALFLYSMTPKLESIYIIVVPSPINIPSPSQSPSPSPSPFPIPTPIPVFIKYQVTLMNITHEKGTGSFVFIITNIGNTPVYRVTVDNGRIIGMTIKMESGETRMYSYTGGVTISPHGPRNNVTCQISWSMDTNSNVFIHTTQWFLVV